MTTNDRTVGRTAAMVGVSVKTLHHWDEIGLVRPSRRSASGYRLYGDEDLARLHRVLIYRELGFGLTEIAGLLDDPGPETAHRLRRQRAQLTARVTRLQRMGKALDRLIEAFDGGILLTAEEQLAIFGADWNPSWAEGAARRWGDTDQWAQFAERAADMAPEDWQRVNVETTALQADLATAVREGVDPESDRADALAERHRALMSNYFDCTRSMHVCIARMYVEDAEFSANWDRHAPGLSKWLRDAVDANARAHGIDPETAVWE